MFGQWEFDVSPTGGIAVASTEVEHFAGSQHEVDTAEVPSAAWGWSRIDHRTWHIVGLCIFGFLLAMLRGNHVGHVEDWFLITFAAVVLFVLARDLWGRRRGWIRRLDQIASTPFGVPDPVSAAPAETRYRRRHRPPAQPATPPKAMHRAG